MPGLDQPVFWDFKVQCRSDILIFFHKRFYEGAEIDPDFTGCAMQKLGSFARNKVLFVGVVKMKNCCELMKELFPLKEHS